MSCDICGGETQIMFNDNFLNGTIRICFNCKKEGKMAVQCLNCNGVIHEEDGYYKCPVCNAIFHKVIFKEEEKTSDDEEIDNRGCA